MSKFDVQPVAKPSRGSFRLGNMHTTTMDFGRLQPVKVMECVPNDVITLNMSVNCQAAPNPSPINGKMSLSLHAFFVPTRIVASEWNNYILGLSNPTLPYITGSQMQTALGALVGTQRADAERVISSFGVPSAYWGTTAAGSMSSYRISAMPLRAFNRIWWDWYRDKMRISDAMQSSYVFDAMGNVSATEASILLSPKYRCFAKDYITTAFDEPSEGGRTAISPVQSSSDANLQRIFNGENNTGSRSYSSSGIVYEVGGYNVNNTSSSGIYLSDGQNTSTSHGVLANIGRNVASNATNTNPRPTVSGQTGVSVPELRSAAAYQRYLERLLVSGKSIISRLKALFNADDTPERLDMSEYLGGTSKDFGFQNTIATAAGSNQSSSDLSVLNAFGSYGGEAADGNILGQTVSHGYCDLKFDNITYHCKEHGYFIVVASIMPFVANYQGVDRMWLRGVATGTCSRFDFFTPDMENVGFQPVLMSEVVTPSPLSGTLLQGYDGLGIFGWQQRYMDYKYSHSQISGDFVNPSTAVSLQSFHLGRNILRELGFINQAGAPVQGSTAPSDFASVVTPANLVACDSTSREAYDDKFTMSSSQLDHFILNFKFDLVASRPMQENALPAIDNAEGQQFMNVPTGGVRL